MHETIYAPDYYILEHHGIKGQKWGIRRYQNKDGTLTAEGRQRQLESRNVSRNKPYTDDVNDIVRTLSKKERDFLGAADNEDWIDKKYERDTLVNKAKTFVSKEGDTPVSFIEIWTDGGRTGQISLATRNDPKYRGKGYASKNVEQAIKWVDRYGNKSIDELEWIADRKNTASVNLGKKYGFVEDNPNKHGHNWKDDWSEEYAIMYRPIKKKAKPTYLAHHGIKGQKWDVRNGPPYPLKDRRSRGSAKVDESKTSNIPNCKKLTNYKGPMYFISTSNMDDKTLEPRVVDNYFTRNGYEDNTTKRVSFAPSVNQCLMGLSQDVSNKDFYVYEPSDRSNLDIYKPNPKAVPDSSVTGELWVTTPVKLKRVGKIHCTGDDGKEGKKFNYGTHTAELYGWNFEWQTGLVSAHSMPVADIIAGYLYGKYRVRTDWLYAGPTSPVLHGSIPTG